MEKCVEFLTHCELLYYEDGSKGFWRIERKRHYKKKPSTDLIDFSKIKTDQSEESVKSTTSQVVIDYKPSPEVGISKDNTKEILAELVSSGFDLKILDKWNGIRNT